MQTLQRHSQSSRFTKTAFGCQPLPREARGRQGWRGRAWLALCVVATLLSLVSFRYLLPHVPFPIRNSNFVLRRPWLLTHVVSASVALLVGPWQFLKSLRTARRELHRRIGWVYVIAVFIGWVSSIPVALHAPSGIPAQAGYVLLGLAWITTTSLGLFAAIQGHFEEHRRWMTRSYALACAAITLRLILPVCLVSGMSFKHAEPFSVWACWIVNLCIAQYLLKAPTAAMKQTNAKSKAYATCLTPQSTEANFRRSSKIFRQFSRQHTRHKSKETSVSYFKPTILCTMLAASSIALYAQTNVQAVETSVPNLKNVVYIAGLDEVKPKVSGELTLSLEALTFHNKNAVTSIPRERIVNAYLGDERTEPWGTTGKIARKIIPYGGGEVLSTLTNKKIDVLTVEYRDMYDGYHGVVFVLPGQKAAALRDRLLAERTTPVEQPAPSCANPLAQSVLLAPIQVRGSELPEEYRVLIYEQTLKELKAKRPEENFFRVGDQAAGVGCAAFTLNLTVTNFKKGNRAVRASTGPLGFFIGATSLTFDVSLQDAYGRTVFASQIKKSDHTDSESLGLADSIAKNVAKSFDRATQSSIVQVASLR